MNTSKRNRLLLILIFTLFLAPVVAAVLLQSDLVRFEPDATVNRGALVTPPVPLPWEQVALVDGTPALEAVGGRWVLLHLLPPACDANCEAVVTDLRQVHIAQGRYQNEVVALLWSERVEPERIGAIYDRFLFSESSTPEWLTGLSASTATSGGEPVAATGDPLPWGTTLIVDPEGNAMLRHATGYDRGDLDKDLGKLLKWSGR